LKKKTLIWAVVFGVLLLILGFWLLKKTDSGNSLFRETTRGSAIVSTPAFPSHSEKEFGKEAEERSQTSKMHAVIHLRDKSERLYMQQRHSNALKRMGLPDISSPLPRRPLQKEALSRPPGVQHRLLVKFHDRLFARTSKEGNLAMSGENIDPRLLRVIQQYRIRFSPNHTVGEDSLVLLEAQALASTKEEPADLGGMLTALPSPSDPETVWSAANALQALDVVEFVTLSSMDSPPPPPGPVDISPTTQLLSALQTYRGTNGINADDAWNRFGAKGQGVRITDCEYVYNSKHEDLTGLVLPQPGSIQYYTGYPDDHATAVLGILTAGENNYGMTGMVPTASVNFYPESATVNGNSQSRSACIAASLTASAPGDVVLLEMQTYGVGSSTGDDRYVVAEYDQGVWVVVKTGTDAGKHVVAAAGNGAQDLDSANYADYRNRGDSGSIIVGAGSTNRAWLSYSTFGSRVNLQGWGQNVATLGYGDLYTYGGDPNQKYSNNFSGTSSASPIVASSVVLVESFVRQKLGRSLTPTEMRRVLIANGKAQTGNLSQRIGPLPNLSTTLTALTSQVITWVNPASIVYGATLSGTQLNATSSVAGTFTYNPTNGAVLNAGTNIVTAVFRATDSNNYVSPLTNTVSLVVNEMNFTNFFSGVNPANVGLDGLAYLVKYALGGTNANQPVVLPTLIRSGNTLKLTATVRTNDPKLSVVGQSLTDLSSSWSNLSFNPNGVASTNTNDVLSGCQRRDFTVDTGTNIRQFLRLKYSLQP